MRIRLPVPITAAPIGPASAKPLHFGFIPQQLRKHTLPARLLLLLLWMVPILVQAQFEYAINADLTVTITGYTGQGGAVVLPGTINGLPVGAIGPYAFYSIAGLTNVSIPDSVTTIGDAAFASCGDLTSIGLGTGVTNIGNSAFRSCTNLTGVMIPDGVRSIADSAFYTCYNLKSIAIPDSVTNLGSSVFWGCSGMTNAVVGNGLQGLGDGTFIFCSSLVSVWIGRNASDLGSNAFGGSGIEAINVDPNNPFFSSSEGVVYDKNQRTLLQFPYNKSGSYAIPGTVTNIADSAFSWGLLGGVIIPDTVIRIGNLAFSNCHNLTNLTVPNCSVGSSAFQSCISLTNVVIANGTLNIEAGEFAYCSALATVTIPGSVTNIGPNAFVMCSSLTSLPVATGVVSIGSSAFELCRGLTNVTLGSSLSSVGSLAFADCASLGGIFFQGNAPAADSSAFANDDLLIVYYEPTASGWTSALAGRPALPIHMEMLLNDPGFGVRSNIFGFNITGSYGLTTVVEATTNITNPNWQPLQTNTLTGIPWYFSDLQWTNYPSRVYRLRWP